MKRFLLLFVILSVTAGCNNSKKGTLLPRTEPSWYENKAYFQEKNSLYEYLPLDSLRTVMLGDDIMDRGEWTLFFNDTCIRNRGIALEGTEHTLYRIESIAKQNPAKIFISTGMRDIKHSESATKIISRISQIIERAKTISPSTKLYYLGIIPDGKMDEKQIDQVVKVNNAIKEKTKDLSFTYIDAPAALTGEKGILSEKYSFDGVNLNGAGYEVLAKTLSEHIGKPALNKANDHNYPAITDFYKTRVSIFNSLPVSEKCVMFLGNSLTNNAEWSELIPLIRTVNRGISGDVTEGIYNRLDDVIEQNPLIIFIMAGINDFINDKNKTAASVWKNYQKIINKLTEALPNTILCVESTLPLNPSSKFYEGINEKVTELNNFLLAESKTGKYVFYDIASQLTDENGDLDSSYTTDGIHLSPDGYFVWCTYIIESGVLLGVTPQQKTETTN